MCQNLSLRKIQEGVWKDMRKGKVTGGSVSPSQYPGLRLCKNHAIDGVHTSVFTDKVQSALKRFVQKDSGVNGMCKLFLWKYV